MNRQVVNAKEVEAFLAAFKPQPQPAVRNRIVPENWKWTASRPAQRAEEQAALKSWMNIAGTAL